MSTESPVPGTMNQSLRSASFGRRQLTRSLPLLILTLPGLVFLVINQYLPILGVVIAFKNINYRDGIFRSPWNGLKNFEFLFVTSDVWIAVRNTLLYNLAFILLGLIFSTGIALTLNELHNKRFSKLFQTMMILPNFLSMIIVAFIATTFLSTSSGLLNTSLMPLLGLEPLDWYASPKYWPLILTSINLWKGAGMGSVIYIAAICGIDPELYEAAVMDGAKKYQQTLHITLPMLLPMMAILTLLSLGNIFRSDFGLFFQVTGDSPLLYPTTDVIDTFVYRSLLKLNDVAMSSAASFFQSVVGCLMLVSVNAVVKHMDESYSLF